MAGSTQAPPHTGCPAGHPQLDPVQTAPVPTVTLQLAPAVPPLQPVLAPQWVASVAGSMQTPLHSICVPGHVTAQAEATQILPLVEQLVPGVPGAPPAAQSPEAPQ